MKKIYTVLFLLFSVGAFAQQPNFFEQPVSVRPLPGSRATADTIFWDPGNSSTPSLYRVPDPNSPLKPAGYLAGTDQINSGFGDVGNFTAENAQIFMNTQLIKVLGAKFCFGAKTWISNDTNSKITFNLYKLDSNYLNVYAQIVPGPGTLLSKVTMKLKDVKILVSGQENLLTGSQNVIFPTPVDVDSGGYVIGYDITQLHPSDTIGLFTSTIGKKHPQDKSLVKFIYDSPWKNFRDSLLGWGADIDLAIFPIVEQTRYTNITADVCYGGSYVFKNQTITQSGVYADTILTDDNHDSIVTLNLTILEAIDTSVQYANNTLTAQTISGATYKWVDCYTLDSVPGQTLSTFSPAQSGLYWVEITKNGCSAHSSCIQVDINCKSFFTVTPSATNGEYNAQNKSIGAGLSYLWDFGDDDTSTSAYPIHVYDQAGLYTICLTISGDSSCSDVFCSDSFYVGGGLISKFTVVNPSIGINDISEINFSLQPNPAKDVCTIVPGNETTGAWNASIYSVQGQLVKQLYATQATQRYTFNTGTFSSGIYLVKITSADGKTGVKKLVIE